MKLFKNRCYNGGNQHRFEARYNEEPVNLNLKLEKAKCSAAVLRELFLEKFISMISVYGVAKL